MNIEDMLAKDGIIPRLKAEDKKQAQITITPMRPPAPSSIGDDLIYDFVGPNTQPAVDTKER